MPQRPTVRTDTSEQRGQNGDPPPSDATQPRQRSGQAFEPLSIRVSGETADDPGAAYEIDEVLRLIADQACLATSATASAIALKQQDEIICRATSGPNTPDLGVSLNVQSGLTGACVRAREAQYCEDTESDPRVNPEACRRLQVRSVLVVPLLKNNEVLGVFEIFSPIPRAFARHDLENLQALAYVILDAMQKPIPAPIPSLIDSAPLLSDAMVSKAVEKLTPAEPSRSPVPPPVASEPARVAAPQIAQEKIAQEKTLEAQRSKAKKESEESNQPAREPDRQKTSAPPLISAPRQAAAPPVDASVVPTKPAVAAAKAPVAPVEKPRLPPQVSPSAATTSSSPSQVRNPAVWPAALPLTESNLQEIPAAAAQPAMSADFLPERPVRSRDWISTFLTVSIIALAVVLGWMLGRVGWERAMAHRAHTAVTDSDAANAAPSNGADDSIMVDPPQRPSSANSPSASGQRASEERAARTAPTSSPFKSKDAGGLVVYQDGKIIFQQTSPGGLDRSGNGPAGASTHADTSKDLSDPPVVISSGVASAHLIQRVEPMYPEEARQRFIQGEVVLEAVVGKDGSVQELKLISGDSQLALAAAAAVQQWRFRPCEQHGQPVAFSTRLTVNFRLH